MTVTFTTLTTGSDTTNQATPYTTATIAAPTANQPVLVSVLVTVGSGTTPPITVSGCGLTWTQIDATSTASRTALLFLGLGASPTAGALSVAGDGATTMTSALWQVSQAAGVDTSTASGVVQVLGGAKPGSSSAISVGFPATVNGGNGTYAGVGTAVAESPTAGSGWTTQGSTTQTAPASGLLGEGSSTARQLIAASWTTAANSFVVGVELAASGGSNFSTAAAFTGSGSLSTVTSLAVSRTASFGGSGSLSTPTLAATASVDFSSEGTLAVTGGQFLKGTAVFSGSGSLTAGRPSAAPVVEPSSVWPPDPYRAAIRSGGYALTYTVDAFYKGAPVKGATGMQPTGGTITDTTKPGVRRVCSLELAPAPGLFDLLSPIGTTLVVTAHIRYPNQQTQDIPMGVFDVDSESLTEGGGSLSLTAPDKWVRVQRNRFMGPVAATVGTRVTAQITALIRGALGASEPVVVTASSTATMKALTWEKDRDQAILDLAKSIGAWVFFDRDGVATIADIPTVASNADWLVDASPSGVLITLDRQRSRTSTCNVVVFSSSASEGPKFPTVYCWDADPASPTYAAPGSGSGTVAPVTTSASAFGLVPYFYDDPTLATLPDAIASAKTILARTRGLASQISLEQAPNPALNAFDSLDVLPPRQRYDIARVLERHVADTVTHPLGVGALHIDGRSTRSDEYVP